MLLKSGIGALRFRMTGHRAPLNVQISLTERCDALCPYCPAPFRPHRELDTATWLAVVDDLAGMGAARVGFGGGEPLLRPDFASIASRCGAHGMWVTLETNGHRYPDLADELRCVDQILVSLDGREAAHDGAREAGSWRRAMAALEAARGRARVGATCTLGRHNLGEVDWLVRAALDGGFDLTFQLVQPLTPRARALVPAAAQAREALAHILALKVAGAPIATSEVFLRYALTWPDLDVWRSERVHEDLVCMAGHVFCAIGADGSVHPCLPRAGEAGPGVAEAGFAAAFAHLRENRCRACTSTACTEYNFLYNLSGPAVLERARATLRRRP
jgi:MoaA/NifB/PqqE/SkfB family radical SAM enzyme